MNQTDNKTFDWKPPGQVVAGMLAAIPVVAAVFYGVAGEDKFLLLSPLMIVSYIGLAVWMLRGLFTKVSCACSPPAFIFWGLFIAYGAMLAVGAEIPLEARIRMLVVALCIGAYFIWSNSLVLFRRSRVALVWLLVFALLGCFYGLVNFFKQPEMVLWVERYAPYTGRLASTYICPNHFAHMLQMLLPFCLVLLFIPQAGIFLRILAGYSMVVFLPTMYFTESRAGMLGSIAALGITTCLLALRKSRKLFILLIVAVPLCATILLAGAWNYSEMFKRRMTPVVEFLAEAKAEGFANTQTRDFRPLTWLDSMDMVAAKPTTGFGPGSYRYAYPEYRKRFKGARVVSGHPHNEYLEVASEYGLVGFGLFALAWCYGLIRILVFSLKTNQQHHAFMAMAFLGTAAGTMLHSFFDFQMHVFQNAMVFSLLAGIAVGPMCGRRQEQLAAKPAPIRRMGTVVLALVAVGGLVLSIITFSSAFVRAKADRVALTGNSVVAKTLYNRAIKIDATNWRAYKGLGLLYAKERRHLLEKPGKQALAQVEATVLTDGYHQNPKDAELAMALGKAVLFLGDDVDAGLEFLRQAALLRPFNDNVWWTYGVEQRKAGRHEEALETFRYAAQIKNTASIRKNIQWLEKRLRGESSMKKTTAPVHHHGVLQKSDKAIPLDDLHELMDAR